MLTSRTPRDAPRVLIVGAGLGGIGLAVHLTRAGLPDFVIFERSDGAGGVWHDNRYPGVAVDIPSAYYSYSFRKTGRWSRAHAAGAELLDYLDEVIDDYGIRPKIRFNTEVRALRWQDAQQRWLVHLRDGSIETFDVVVTAVGVLNVPRYPEVPGMATFGGAMFHTARWEDHDLAGKRVAYIGAGSSAAQVVPALTRHVAKLHVYQREPHWVLPKDDPEVPPEQRKLLRRRPWLAWQARWRAFAELDRVAKAATVGSPQARAAEAVARDYLERVRDPEVRAAMTPRYPFMCKRPVQACPEYFEAFNEAHVELVPHGIRGFTREGIVSDDGRTREVDVVVLGTGFQATNYLATLDVTGPDGIDLHETWDRAGGPYSYLGLAVPRFPNLLMLSGPTSHVTTSAIFVTEQQAHVVVAILRRMRRRGWTSVEVRRTVTDRYLRWVDAALAGHPSAVGGCNNYYTLPSGKIVTLFPSTAKRFWLACHTTARLAFSGQRDAAPRSGRDSGSGATNESRVGDLIEQSLAG